MKQRSFVQRLDAIRRDLKRKRALGIKTMQKPTPWRVVARDYPGVPAGTLCAIAKGRVPHKPEILHALGLPHFAPARVCPNCEQVMEAKRCPHCSKQKRAGKPRHDWKAEALAWKSLYLTVAGLWANWKTVVR